LKPADILEKKEYLKDKMNELATNSKNKNIRDLYKKRNEFKRGYQPRKVEELLLSVIEFAKC
jgi:hypothetical protein